MSGLKGLIFGWIELVELSKNIFFLISSERLLTKKNWFFSIVLYFRLFWKHVKNSYIFWILIQFIILLELWNRYIQIYREKLHIRHLFRNRCHICSLSRWIWIYRFCNSNRMINCIKIQKIYQFLTRFQKSRKYRTIETNQFFCQKLFKRN